ncbi:single-stranded DNA-binding protein [Undibacterium arcticum]
MASVNKVIIVGNLGRDPEMRYMPSGDAMATIAVATTDSWKDKNTGEKKRTNRVAPHHLLRQAGRDRRPVPEKKGSQVYIEGSLRTRKYTDKDGVEKYATDIRADTMQMLGGRQGMGSAPMDEGYSAPAPRQQASAPAPASAPRQAAKPAPNFFSDMDDDIPF